MLFLLSMNSYSNYAGMCVSKLDPYFSNYFLDKKEKLICDKRGNKCSFFTLVNNEKKTVIITFGGYRSKLHLFNYVFSHSNKLIDFFGMGLINSYIYLAQQTIWFSVKTTLELQTYKNYKIILTGYGLGGALASLTALRIQLLNIAKTNRIYVYTFSEPRIGNVNFANNYNQRIVNSWRVVLGANFLPHLPACKKKISKFKRLIKSYQCDPQDVNSYYHHGTEIWYKEKSSSYIVCHGLPKGEDFKCSDSLHFSKLKYLDYKSNCTCYFDNLKQLHHKIIDHTYDKTCKKLYYEKNYLSHKNSKSKY